MQNLPNLAIFNVNSGYWIPVPFRYKYRNDAIPVAGMIFWLVESTGMTGIQQE
jgi:hypothetical protein